MCVFLCYFLVKVGAYIKFYTRTTPLIALAVYILVHWTATFPKLSMIKALWPKTKIFELFFCYLLQIVNNHYWFRFALFTLLESKRFCFYPGYFQVAELLQFLHNSPSNDVLLDEDSRFIVWSIFWNFANIYLMMTIIVKTGRPINI